MATPPPSKKAKYQCRLGVWPLPFFHFRKLATMLVHTVKLKPIIKAQISVKLVTIGISYVVTASVYSEKPV